MENTNPNGSESLDVNQAASAFAGMMGDSEEAEQGQTEEQPEYQQETDEVEYSEEGNRPYRLCGSGS
jgi:lipopolysaccharide export system protein LptC